MARKPKNGAAVDDRNNFDKVDRATQELFYHHKRRITQLENESQVASRALSAAKKRATEELGETAIDDIKQSRKWDKKGGEAAVKAAFERLARLARWAGFSSGVQAELFSDAPVHPSPFERGRLAGLNGDEANPPFDAGSAEGQEWLAGFHDGQAAIFNITSRKAAEETESDDEDGDGEETEGDDAPAPPPIGDQDATTQVQH